MIEFWIILGLITVWAIWSYRNLGHEMDELRKDRPLVTQDTEFAEFEREETRKRFAFQQATAATGPKQDEVIAKHRALALWVTAAIPPGPERTQALVSLQESMMWCNAGVGVRTEPEPLPFGMPDKA